MKKLELEALYRKYFYDIRGFRPFPMELTYQNVMDFAEWLIKEAAGKVAR